MADRRVCIDANFTTDASGALGIAPWAFVQTVATSRRTAVQTVTTPDTALPGRLLDAAGTPPWRNDAPMDRDVVVLWSTPAVRLDISNPNAVQVRARLRVLVEDAPSSPSIPDPTGSYEAAWTASTDMGTDGNGVPLYSQYHRAFPGGLVQRTARVGPGQYLQVLWSLYAWNPPPYANNASANNALTRATVYGHDLAAYALPNVEGGVL